MILVFGWRIGQCFRRFECSFLLRFFQVLGFFSFRNGNDGEKELCLYIHRTRDSESQFSYETAILNHGY